MRVLPCPFTIDLYSRSLASLSSLTHRRSLFRPLQQACTMGRPTAHLHWCPNSWTTSRYLSNCNTLLFMTPESRILPHKCLRSVCLLEVCHLFISRRRPDAEPKVRHPTHCTCFVSSPPIAACTIADNTISRSAPCPPFSRRSWSWMRTYSCDKSCCASSPQSVTWPSVWIQVFQSSGYPCWPLGSPSLLLRYLHIFHRPTSAALRAKVPS